MIPQKLYIPTTTLNFNNIMASESISPAGFYSTRGFGYKRFDKVEPNNLDRRITLYDKYPNFDINDMELENYPLVIEIAPQYVAEDLIREYKDGVFYTEETIYLNPFSTKIYFRNEDERRRTLSKVEQSLNTKMISIYQNCIYVKTSYISSFEWKKNDLTDSIDDSANHISKDRKINKLKGFMYAYLLGANRSLSHEVVMLKKYAKELRNTISAIITNPDGYGNYKQKEELDVLYQKINDAFFYADGVEKIVQNRLKQKAEEYNCPNFTDILKKENLYNTWFQQQNLTPSYRIKTFNLLFSQKNYTKKKGGEYNNNELEENQKYFDAYFAELDNTIGKHIKSINTNISDLPVLRHCNMVERIPSDKTGFQAKLFNEYAGEHWNSEEFLASRFDFATVGGKLFKEELQDNWENSPSKAYINDLRKNLASHTPFVLNSIHNLTLQSFAVFSQKGEEDIDKLEDYLMSNAIGDFRIAFALWGTVFGFANMPKTLTNDLFLSDDLNYISDVYKYIFKQVHGIDLDGKIERKQEKKSTITFSSKLNVDIPAKFKVDEKKETITEQANGIEVEYREKLKQIPKISATQIDSIIEVLKSNHFIVNKSLELISKIKGFGKTSKIFKAIKECLLPNQQKSIQQYESTLGFDFPPEKEFYLDDNAWSYIEHLPFKNQDIKYKVRKNLKTIQDGYRPNGFYYNRGDSNENKEVINHFLIWNISEKNKFNKLQEYDFPNEIREEIRKILESKYPN